MIYGSVCSGIEAASVAWEPLGWKPAFFSEIDRFACSVLNYRFPAVPLHGDFRTIVAGDYADVDVLVGGTPCQDFSVAGLRAGLAGDRGALTIEFLHLAQRLRPRWLVWENVPGVLSADAGRAFGTFLGLLGKLGYGFAYRVLDAQYFGVPQRRRRVFVVGYFGDWRRAAAVLFERESLSRNPPPSRETGSGPSLCVTIRFGSGRNDPTAETYITGFCNTAGATNLGIDENNGTMPPLTTRNGDPGMVAFTCKDSGADAGDVSPTLRAMTERHSTPNGGGQVAVVFYPNMSEDAGSNGARVELCGTLSGGNGGNQQSVAIAWTERGRDDGRSVEAQEEIAYCLRNPGAGGGGSSRGSIAQGSAVRRLTPRECERLQGFPDDFTLVPYRKKPAADGPRYRALGNSMAVPCMKWLGERIAMVDALE